VAISLADREAEVMVVLWDRGPCTVADVRERLKDELAYTTVLSVLRTLEAKGYVRHEGVGRAHRYSAAVERTAARRSALRHLAQKLFDGSVSLLLSHLASDQGLSEAQIKRIQRLIDERSKKRKP
jgi:predicted transcriptional regulator